MGPMSHPLSRSPRTMLPVLLFIALTRPQLTFAADLVYTIPEEQPPGSHVGNLVDDTDLEQYVSSDSINTLRFSFLAGETAYTNLFRLDETTGDLTTSRSRKVDRERVCPYDRDCILPLQVAIQSTLNQFFRKVSVDINVTDINDNTPTFDAKSAEVIISETVSIPSTFPLMSALDLDMGPNNGLKDYQLVPPAGPFGLVFTPGSPNLRLVVQKGELDHERQENYQVKVIARDGGSPPRTGTLMVNITIEDENDNEPVFTEPSYSVTVDENVAKGFVLLQVTATDRDSRDNGRVRYRLSPQQAHNVLTMFTIDAVSGELTVAGDIENSDKDSYDIIVEATDMGSPQPFSTSTTVTVTVRDTINSPPKLTVSLLAGGHGYSTISEYASVGAVVAHIAVKDADRGRNGIVQCDIERYPYFELQGFDVNEYKVIVARPLDRETAATHNVTVYCTDAGVRPLTASSTFEVRIMDENDNSPKFLQDSYHVYLPENTVQGRTLITVKATDPDAGDNGKVRYSLHPNARGRFIISPESGVIITHDDFDYELETGFNFTVLATDQGKPPRSHSVDVRVSIVDINDQKPSFARDVFPFTVSEFAVTGKVVGRVTANDFEQGLNGQVEVVTDRYSAMGMPFTVLKNGTIILTGPLDHETTSYYYFRVMAIDLGHPPLNDTADVQVTVLDENDNRPLVTHPNGTELQLFVSMDDDIARPVAMIKAQDPDSGLNGQIQFIITSRNDSGRFDVDANSGEVFITRSLTRSDVSLYRLQVLVQDSGTPPLPADRTITVWIHAGNGTRSASPDQAGDQYILITLAIVCITIILSAIIVLIIVVLRRMDRRRKPPSMHIQNSRVLGTYSDRVKADNVHNECVDGELGEKVYGGGGFETFGKGICEEDEEFGFSTFTGGSGKQEDLYGANTHSLATDDSSKIPLPVETGLPESSSGLPVRANPDSHVDLDTLQLRHVFLQAYQQQPEAVQDTWQPVVRHEDGQSNSSAETIPSDSGRGGSEEDMSHCGQAGGAALNDDCRLAALHDASFQSSVTNSYTGSQSLLHSHPSKSNVRDPVRNSSRKHVTFKDLAAGKRDHRPLGTSGLASGTCGGTGGSLDSPRGGGSMGHSPRSQPGSLREAALHTSNDSPRYAPLSTRDSPRAQRFAGLSGSRESLNSPRGSQEAHDSPRNLGAVRAGVQDLQGRGAESYQESSLDGPVYVNEPFSTMQGTSSSPPSSSSSAARDRSRYPNLFKNVGSKDKSSYGATPLSSFKNSQELQTFYPVLRPASAKQNSSGDTHSQQTSRNHRETSLGSRDARQGRDWREDNEAAGTDDYDDQRSTTTSGSYTIDNEDTYVGLDLNRSPWKDVVV